MRVQLLSAVLLLSALSAAGQATASSLPPLPKDAREILAAALPLYDFRDPSLRPWHLKAAYQLYDDAGRPGEAGTYEYWWVSPKAYRRSWTRPGASHTDWYTEDGQHSYQDSGEPLSSFEYRLQSALVSPLPELAELDSAKDHLERETTSAGSLRLRCVMAVPQMRLEGHIPTVPLGLFPSWCFDPTSPVLRLGFSWGSVAVEFNDIVRVQGRILARQIDLVEGRRQILSAKVSEISSLAPGDPALRPPADARIAKSDHRVELATGLTAGMLVRKQPLVYPQDAKDARVSGTVVLRAVIGRDGGIHELSVVSTPWPSLAASALWSVSRWQYKPYLLNGEPVEVETTINAIFSIGR